MGPRFGDHVHIKGKHHLVIDAAPGHLTVEKDGKVFYSLLGDEDARLATLSDMDEYASTAVEGAEEELDSLFDFQWALSEMIGHHDDLDLGEIVSVLNRKFKITKRN